MAEASNANRNHPANGGPQMPRPKKVMATEPRTSQSSICVVRCDFGDIVFDGCGTANEPHRDALALPEGLTMKCVVLAPVCALVVFLIGCSMPVWTVLLRPDDPDSPSSRCGPQQGPLSETLLELPEVVHEAIEWNAWNELFRLYQPDLVRFLTLVIFAAAVGGVVYGTCGACAGLFRRWSRALSHRPVKKPTTPPMTATPIACDETSLGNPNSRCIWKTYLSLM